MSILPGDLNPKTLTVPGATTSSPASTPSRTTLAKLLVEGDVSPVAQSNLALIDAAFGVPASFSAAPASYSAAGVAGNVAFDSAALYVCVVAGAAGTARWLKFAGTASF